jgi:signal transduction histidine kinase/ActR/RegA family two-component response regulator/HPt (histidine-containing phosphotransfer) domain-containing protein
VVAVAEPTGQPLHTLALSGQSWLVLAIGLIATIAGGTVMFREARRARRRESRLARDGAALAAAYTELAAAKTRAEANNAQLEATLSGMSDGVIMLDANHRLLQWNDRFPEIAGVPREVLRVGVSLEEMIRAQALAGEYGAVDVEAEVRWRMDLVHSTGGNGASERVRPNGRVLALHRTALPGGGFVVHYSDITARKLAEAAQRETRRLAEAAIEQKAQFVAMVSHELRVPLNAVVSCLALLDQPGLTAHQRDLAETARQAGATLLDLVTDILELSKMDAGRLTLRPADFELAALLEGVCDMFRAPAAARGMRLALHIAADVPRRLHADAGRLRQILMNFTSNACKYSRPGTVAIRAESMEVDGVPTLRLAVRDQGPCIPEQQAASLFVPFAQLDYARESGAAGTGLGLAICEQLTQLMGGRIGLDPSPSADDPLGGNEFWVTLPLAPAQHAGWPDGIEVDRLQRPTRRASVLLVEDVASNRMLTAALLRRDGHRVDLAESGAEAIRLAASRPYDVVFMDLMMPGMDGCETARRIRGLPGPEGRLPIVALTARDMHGNPAELLDAGMNLLLAKPIRPDDLSEALAAIVWPVTAHLPAAPTASAVPPSLIDTVRLADVQRGLPAGLFAVLVDQCIGDMRARLLLLRQALDAGDADAVTHAAHALAGMAGGYALAALERRMRAVMTAGKSGDMVAVAAELVGLDHELDRSAELVQSLLQPRAA